LPVRFDIAAAHLFYQTIDRVQVSTACCLRHALPNSSALQVLYFQCEEDWCVSCHFRRRGTL